MATMRARRMLGVVSVLAVAILLHEQHLVLRIARDIQFTPTIYNGTNITATYSPTTLPTEELLCNREQVRDGFWGRLVTDAPPYDVPLDRTHCYPNPSKDGRWESWEWLPWNTTLGDGCRFTRRDKNDFCSLLQQHYSSDENRTRTVAIVGDSLSLEHYNSLVLLLRLQLTIRKVISSDIHWACNDTVKLVYQGDRNLRTLASVLRDEKPQIVVLNRGAHYVGDALLSRQMRQSILHLKEWQQNCTTNCRVFYRTTVPGHPNCQNYTMPSNSTTEMEASIANQSFYLTNHSTGFHWWDFQHQNELVLKLWEQSSLDYEVIDGYDLNVLRPDLHQDCLHNCYPGKMDVYNDLMIHNPNQSVVIFLHRSRDRASSSSVVSKIWPTVLVGYT